MKINWNHIIWATDFSDCARLGFPYAAALAKVFNVKLTACHAVDISTVSMYGEAMVDPEEIQERILAYARDEIGDLAKNSGIEVDITVALGRPADEIRELCESLRPGLVVAATRGRSGLERIVLGSVTEQLMHTLCCPLLAIKETERSLDEQKLFKKILIGCDFSADSNRAVEYGLALAQEFQSEAHLVHVVDPKAFQGLMEPGMERNDSDRKGIRDQLMERLMEMIPVEAGNWCKPEMAVLAGRPHEELIKYASLNAIDLAVLGVHGRGFVEKLLVGSTLDRFIRHGPIPVLAVRAPD